MDPYLQVLSSLPPVYQAFGHLFRHPFRNILGWFYSLLTMPYGLFPRCCFAARSRTSSWEGLRSWEPKSRTRRMLTRIRAITNEIADMGYEAASASIVTGNAEFARDQIQKTNDENDYWQIILKWAADLKSENLPGPKAICDGFSAAEKRATFDFISKAGLGTSNTNQLQYRWFWKALHEFRKKGVKMVTCYRTPAFNTYCKQYSRAKEL